mmetsp:Transcript_126071/g.218607  ORF Transcript_126071/g.218607 Transcript_126071/m.218607 type:complete len:963 (+) Transcript_126071:58-2946(+)
MIPGESPSSKGVALRRGQSPKGSSHGEHAGPAEELARNLGAGPKAAGAVLTILSGLALCALITFQLHRAAQKTTEASTTPAEHRLHDIDAPGFQTWDEHYASLQEEEETQPTTTPPPKVEKKTEAPDEDPEYDARSTDPPEWVPPFFREVPQEKVLQDVSKRKSNVRQFALVPRPTILKVLVDLGETKYTPLQFLYQVPEGREKNSQVVAALGEFKRVLDDLHGHSSTYWNPEKTPEAKWEPGLSSKTLPVGAVGLALFDDRDTACDACAVMVDREEAEDCKLLHGYARLDLPVHSEREWHIAIHFEGRMAVCATHPEGLFRFASTLQQMGHSPLLKPRQTADRGNNLRHMHWIYWNLFTILPPFLVEDYPKHGWRGLQLDTVRHFMNVTFIKRYLRAMSYYKANVFHWHLTDDQAWRLYIPSRPHLVNASNKTNPGFYTHADVQEVVMYALKLFINVVPVIETPGHSLAALAAYPDLACKGDHFEVPQSRVGTYSDILCVGKREVSLFAYDVFSEVVKLFPSPYIHVGGDEIPTTRWEESKHTRAFAGMVGLKNLQADVLEAWYCFLSKLMADWNKTIIVWDDHFANQLSVTKRCPEAQKQWIVQAWKFQYPVGTMGDDNEFLHHAFPYRTIASPMKRCYLDYPVASIDFNKTLKFDPGRDAHHHHHLLLGGCANMWTEDTPQEEVGSKVYPRFIGLSERFWDGGVNPDEHRVMDLPVYLAAQQHCAEDGPLRKEFGFKCGKFGWKFYGRLPIWQKAHLTTTIDSFADEFKVEMALDGDKDTYFWGIAPKSGDVIQVIMAGKDGKVPLGKWLDSLVVATGSRDRPGDQLDHAELEVVQWLPKDGGYEAKSVKVGEFEGGTAKASSEVLEKGPVLAVRISVTETQTKWVALPEIAVEETLNYPAQPRQSDLPEELPRSLRAAADRYDRWRFPKLPQVDHDRKRPIPLNKRGYGHHPHNKRRH